MPAKSEREELIKLLATEVRRFREERGLSQELFAEKMNISLRQLQKIEAGLPRTSFISFLALLGLMKDEPRVAFIQRMLEQARIKLGVQPLHRGDTTL